MDIAEIRSIVIEAYKSILGRDPSINDPSGLENYTNMIAHGASKGRLEQILRDSDEYKELNKTKSKSIFESQSQHTPTQTQFTPTTPEYRSIVIEAYKSILGRDPSINDPAGLEYYTNMIAQGLSKEKLEQTLRESTEYRTKIVISTPTSTQQQTGGIESISKIAYCMMGTNRLHEIKDYIPSVLDYIDTFIFIDGGSSDGTGEYLNSLNNEKIEVYGHPWNDRFSGQRNNYIQKLRDRDFQGWMLVSDTDEHFPQETLKGLNQVISMAEQAGIQNIMFHAIDIFLDENRDNVTQRLVSNYWKSLLFKFNPKIHYEGEPHESVMGVSGAGFKSELIYEHSRTHLKILERATENFFISNSNRYSEKWVEFRYLCKQAGIEKFNNFFDRFKAGTLTLEVERWIWEHRDDNINEGDSEVREMAKLYFEVLHPGKEIKS